MRDDLEIPNSLAFSPDETVLYIIDTAPRHIKAFDVDREGNLSNVRVFANLQSSTELGIPDGMKVDQEGNVYSSGPGGLWVMDPSGKPLGRFVLPELPCNMAWGDHDWKTLYVAARTSIYRMRLNIPGVPLVPRHVVHSLDGKEYS